MRAALAALFLGTCLAGGASAATLFSDDFESDALGTPSVLNNWVVSTGTIDVIGPGNGYPWYGAGQYVDLNGTPGPARIETILSFNLVAGQGYTLSFDYGNNKNSNGVEQLSFGIGGFSDSIDIPGAIASLISSTYSFTALTTGSFNLFFADTGNTPSDLGGPILDNVSLTTAVPLPAGGLLLLTAFGGLAGVRRRRKSA